MVSCRRQHRPHATVGGHCTPLGPLVVLLVAMLTSLICHRADAATLCPPTGNNVEFHTNGAEADYVNCSIGRVVSSANGPVSGIRATFTNCDIRAVSLGEMGIASSAFAFYGCTIVDSNEFEGHRVGIEITGVVSNTTVHFEAGTITVVADGSNYAANALEIDAANVTTTNVSVVGSTVQVTSPDLARLVHIRKAVLADHTAVYLSRVTASVATTNGLAYGILMSGALAT